MKRKIGIITAIALAFASFAGCVNPAAPTETESASVPSPSAVTEASRAVVGDLRDENGELSVKYVGMCFPQLANPWFVAVKDDVQRVLEAEGVKVEYAAADNNHARQMEIIENYGEKNVDGIVIFPIGASDIGSTLEKMQEKGVRVIVFVNKVDKGFDGMLLTNYVEQGTLCSQAAAKWIDETFPDAAPGTVEVGVLSINMSPESQDVCNALRSITQYTDKAKLVVDYEAAFADPEAKHQENAEMLLSKFPNVKCVLTYNNSLVVDEVVMRTRGIDYDNFAIFTNTFDPIITERIAMSRTNESVIRGNVISGDGTFGHVAEAMLGRVEFNEEKIAYDPLYVVTAENAEDFLN
jgi:ribose transport system substrate-binding protein